MSNAATISGLDVAAVPRHRADIWRTYPDGTVRFTDFLGQHVILNQRGARVWKLMDGKRTIADIHSEVVRDSAACDLSEQEMLDFISYLLERKWLSLGKPTTWNNDFFVSD